VRQSQAIVLHQNVVHMNLFLSSYNEKIHESQAVVARTKDFAWKVLVKRGLL
jgi:sulfur transfer complex TusBCD TusB component (DsrH family)